MDNIDYMFYINQYGDTTNNYDEVVQKQSLKSHPDYIVRLFNNNDILRSVLDQENGLAIAKKGTKLFKMFPPGGTLDSFFIITRRQYYSCFGSW